jgi:hypothetical protein
MKDCIKRNTLHQENNPDHKQLRRMRQKEEFLALGEGVQNGDPSHSPPTLVANRDNLLPVNNLLQTQNCEYLCKLLCKN